MPIDEKRFPKYTNIYFNVIKKEFKSHNDEVNCITVLNESFSFNTCSKEKFIKIWNINCECLGVISSFIKVCKNNPLPEWKFKINEEKILEDEINDVVEIFEKVGARKIVKGSKEDKEIENILADDKNNNNKKEKKKKERKTKEK